MRNPNGVALLLLFEADTGGAKPAAAGPNADIANVFGRICKRLQSPSPGGSISGSSKGFAPFVGVLGAVPGRISKFGVNETMRPLS